MAIFGAHAQPSELSKNYQKMAKTGTYGHVKRTGLLSMPNTIDKPLEQREFELAFGLVWIW